MVFELSRRGGRSGPAVKAGPGGGTEAADTDRSLPLEERQKRLEQRLVRIAGKIWNAPNTALGLGYGLTGYGLGMLMQIGKDKDERAATRPEIRVGDNAIQFIKNPLGGVGAITLGDTTTYAGDPSDRTGRWKDWWDRYGFSPELHEAQHIRQGERLGPLYLPSNILGGIYAVLRDPPSGDRWHGPSNWNETGPQMSPPRPWPERGW